MSNTFLMSIRTRLWHRWPMRRIVTGVDGGGRSCVVEETELSATTEVMFQTATSPPPPRPRGHGSDLDLHVSPGIVRWIYWNLPPGPDMPSQMHHTNTVDFDMVLSGSVDIVLDDGAHRLESGDCVVVTGVDHGWKAGPEGCTISVLVVGTPPGP